MHPSSEQELRRKKARIREEIAAATEKLDEGALRAGDEAILATLLSHPSLQGARTLFCYISVGREPDTRAFLQKMLAEGRRICVPRCKKGGVMEARQITDFTQLRPAPFGLLEPGEDRPLVPPEEIDLVVAPCVSAGRDHRRLGHGAGYYDRFLAPLTCPVLCLCRENLLREGLPVDATDVRMDAVITEKGVW